MKSKMNGVYVLDIFLARASAFLNCFVASLPFKFLGILVGRSPTRVTF